MPKLIIEHFFLVKNPHKKMYLSLWSEMLIDVLILNVGNVVDLAALCVTGGNCNYILIG